MYVFVNNNVLEVFTVKKIHNNYKMLLKYKQINFNVPLIHVKIWFFFKYNYFFNI